MSGTFMVYREQEKCDRFCCKLFTFFGFLNTMCMLLTQIPCKLRLTALFCLCKSTITSSTDWELSVQAQPVNRVR